MSSYQIQLEGNLLKVGFTTPASGEDIVKDVRQKLSEMIDSGELTGGKILKINGRISVLASYTLAHEVVHLFGAIAVFDPRLQAYVVVNTTTPDYPFGARIDGTTGKINTIMSTSVEPSVIIRYETDLLQINLNQTVVAEGDQIVKDTKAQLQQLIEDGQLSLSKNPLKINGKCPVLASFVIACQVAHLRKAIAVFDPKVGTEELGGYVITISHSPNYALGEMI
jgi:CRISPR-associated protein Csx3